MNYIKSFLKEESGAAAFEYVLLIGVVAAVIAAFRVELLAAASSLGKSLTSNTASFNPDFKVNPTTP